MRCIDADALVKQLQKDEELARKRVLDTESCMPYPNNLNPSYTRYVAQMDERMRLKHMVADAPTIEPERKKGKWILADAYAGKRYRCSECLAFALKTDDGKENLSDFCPCCGAYMEREKNETN